MWGPLTNLEHSISLKQCLWPLNLAGRLYATRSFFPGSHKTITRSCKTMWQIKYVIYLLPQRPTAIKLGKVLSYRKGLQCIKATQTIKGCVRYIFVSLLCKSKGEHFWNREKCFLFHFKSSFRSWDTQILTFPDIQMLWCHQIPKHETPNTYYWITWEVNSLVMKLTKISFSNRGCA